MPSKYGGSPVDDDQTKAGGSKYGGVAVGSGSPAPPVNMQLTPESQNVKLQEYQNPNEPSIRAETPTEYAGRTARNIPGSFARNVAGLVTGPIDLVASGVNKVFGTSINIPKSAIDEATGFQDPGLAGYYTNNFKQNFSNDPVRALSDASVLFHLGSLGTRVAGWAAGKAGAQATSEGLGAVGNVLSRAADLTNPLAIPGKVIGGAPNALYKTGQVLGNAGEKTANAITYASSKAPPSLAKAGLVTANTVESLTDNLASKLKAPREYIRNTILPKVWGFGGNDLTEDAQNRLKAMIDPVGGAYTDSNGNIHARIFNPAPSYAPENYGKSNVLSMSPASTTQIQGELEKGSQFRQAVVTDPAVADVIIDPQKAETLKDELRQKWSKNRTESPDIEKSVSDTINNFLSPSFAGRRPGAGIVNAGDFDAKTGGYLGTGAPKMASPVSVGEAAGYSVGPNGEKIPGVIGSLDAQARDAYDALRKSGGWKDVSQKWVTQTQMALSGLLKDETERITNVASGSGPKMGTMWRQVGMNQSDLIDLQNIIKMQLGKEGSTLIKDKSGYITMSRGRIFGSVAQGALPSAGPIYANIIQAAMNRPWMSKILANVLSTVPVDSGKLRWIHTICRGLAEHYNTQQNAEQQQPPQPAPPANMENQ